MNLLLHLSCFVAVAEELHFGRAAGRLQMSQPPLSQRIRRLEQTLDVRLFDRSSRHVALTAAGELLLDDAREILARAERVYALSERSRFGESDTLRAALPSDLGGTLVAALIDGFRARRPDVTLDLRAIETADQLAALADGSLDAGVVALPCDTRAIELGPTLTQPIGVLMRADGAHAGAPEVHPADLAGTDLVTFPRDDAPGAFDEMIAGCRRHGYDPPAVHAARGAEFTLGLVLAGGAVALVPKCGPFAGAVWRPLLGDPVRRRCAPVWRRNLDPARTRAVEDFVTTATSVLKEHAEMHALNDTAAPIVVPRPASGLLT